MPWNDRFATALLVVLALGAPLTAPSAARAEAADTEVFAGTGTAGSAGDGGPASAAQLNQPTGVAVAADGTVYVSDGGNHTVRAIAPDGTISTVAGTGAVGAPDTPVPDGARGTEVALSVPQSLAIGADNSLYIADTGRAQVFRLAPDGVLSLVAGSGARGSAGDGGPAIRAALGQLGGLAVAPDGTVYIGDITANRVRAVAPNGAISTVAGSGGSRVTAAGGPARTVPLPHPGGLAVDRQGDLWITGELLVRRLRGGDLGTVTVPDGADGGRWALATEASWPPPEPPLNNVAALAAGPDGVYLLDQSTRAVRRLGSANTLDTVATLTGVDGPATGPIAISASGVGYVVDNAGHRVYRFRLTAKDDADAPDDGSTFPWWPVALGGAIVVVGVVVWLAARRRRTT